MNHGLDQYAQALDAALGYDAPRVHDNRPFWIGQAVGATGIIGRVAYSHLSRKRDREDDDDDNFNLREATGLDLSKPTKKLRGSRANLTQVSRPSGNQNMGLLTYRRQTGTSFGRRRRTVRRLARAKRRKAYATSATSLISNTYPLTYPAADSSSFKEGQHAYMYYVPSLAQVIERVNADYKQPTGASTTYSTSFGIQIPKQRWEWQWTPDWSNATYNTASQCPAMVFRVTKFILRQKTPIQEVICTPGGKTTPDALYYFADNYTSAAYTGVNGLPLDHTAGIIQRGNAATTIADCYSSATGISNWGNVRKEPLTVFDSPAFMAKVVHKYTKEFYVPWGQTIRYTCGHGPINVSYRDLEISRPELYAAKNGTTQGDNYITPYLPRGWPIYVMDVVRHLADPAYSTANPATAETIGMRHRLYYKIPDCLGRKLSIYNANSTTWRYGNVAASTTGVGETGEYTGMET